MVVSASFTLVALAARASAEPSARDPQPSASLRDRLGVERADTLRVSSVLEDRIRGLERLGSVGSARAVERLVRAVAPGGGVATPEERLVAVRELARFTDQAEVRRALASVLTGHAAPATSEARSPLDRLAQSTAAVALARSGAADAIEALGRALEIGETSGELARAALLGYPPRDLAPLLRSAAAPSEIAVKTLVDLGDQRAFDVLRSFVRTASPAVRAIAAVGLTRLGDFETVELARAWLARGAPDTLRVAAATILALAHAADAPRAIARLLDDDSTWYGALDLSLDAPNPELVPALTRRLATADDEPAGKILAALGRCGGKDAARTLEGELSNASRGALAANALARMTRAEGGVALTRALAKPETRRLGARGGTLRYLVLGEEISGLRKTLEALARSSDEGDRAAGASGLAALDPRWLERELTSANESDARDVASLLLLLPGPTAWSAAARISRAADASTREALALSLAVPGSAAAVPTAALVALVDAGGPAALLAVRALAARNEPDLGAFVETELGSGDPWIRAHAAFGLGENPAPESAGLLSDAYRFEMDPSVRAAIVRALSERDGGLSGETLRLALLDSDPRVLDAARLAERGGRLGPTARGDAAALFAVARTNTEKVSGNPTILLKTSGDLALPLIAGPDGIALIGGLCAGPVELRVAPGPAADEDSERGRVGSQESHRRQRSGAP